MSDTKPTGDLPVESRLGRTEIIPAGSGRRHEPQFDGVQGSQPATPMGPALAWHAYRHWWHICLPVGTMLAVSLALGVWYTFVPEYEAEGLIQIESQAAFVFLSEKGAVGTGNRFESTQIELIRSPVVLGRILEQPDIASLREILEMKSPIETLRDKLEIGSQNESELFYVRYRSPSARIAALIVNRVIEQYTKMEHEKTVNRNLGIVRDLNGEAEKRASDVKRLRLEVRRLEEDLDLVGVSLSAEDQPLSGPQARLRQLMRQRNESQAERETLMAMIGAYEANMEDLPKLSDAHVAGIVRQAVEQSAELQSLQQQLAEEQRLLTDLLRRTAQGENDPKVKQSRAEISTIQTQIDELRSSLEKELGPEIRSQIADQQKSAWAAEVAKMRFNVQTQEALEALWTKQIEDLGNPTSAPDDTLGASPDDEQLARLEEARGDLAREEYIYKRLHEQADIVATQHLVPSRVKQHSPADPPLAPLEAVPIRKMATAGVAGFLLPFVIAFLWEFRIQRVTAGQQVSELTMLPLLGEVPVLPLRSWPATGRRASRFEAQRARFQDSVHYLSRSLLLSEQGQNLQVLAVTSAVSGEGKTTLASQLALSIAIFSHEPVLLIDADMRKPNIHEVFNTRLEPGLAELLADGTDDADIDSAITQGQQGLVSVLPAGKLSQNPHGILSVGRFERILARLRRSYSYIVIDTPPVGVVGEALSVCKSADATLLAVRQDWSRQPQVRTAYERVLGVGANPIGVVLSGVSHRHYASEYGYYETSVQS